MHESVEYLGCNDWRKVFNNICGVLEQYVKQAGLSALIIGESGGIDSALSTIIARNVCDKLGLKLYGRSISIETNTKEERERSSAIGALFCDDYKEVDLTELYFQMRDAIDEEEMHEDPTSRSYKLRMGNIKARVRMIYLYNLSQRYKGMVLSTDNQTEWMLGFWTLHGDVGDFDPLFGLWKTEVYKLAKYVVTTLGSEEERNALQACIDCIPTDGLGITSSDVEQLGAHNYSEVDHCLIAYLKDGIKEINPAVVSRHLSSEFKRNNPRFVSREESFKE